MSRSSDQGRSAKRTSQHGSYQCERIGVHMDAVESSPPEGEPRKPDSLDQAQQTDQQTLPLSVFPQEVAVEIIKYLAKDNINTALECRLVNSFWREAVDNCPSVMKKLIFDVPFWKTFLYSNLASKVKAVRYTKGFKEEENCVKQFVKEIGQNVEHVIYHFDKYTTDEQLGKIQVMFSALMDSSPKLKEFHITSECRHFLRPLTVHELGTFGTSLQILKVNIQKMEEEVVTKLKQFVLCLSSLSSLDLYAPISVYNFGSKATHLDIIEIINAHIKFHDSLKKVSTTDVNFKTDERLMEKLVLTAVNRDLDVDLTEVGGFDLSLDEFMKYAAREGHEIPTLNNKYYSVKRGYLFVKADDMQAATERIQFFVNLESLDLVLEHGCKPQRIGFIAVLAKLKELKLSGHKWLPGNYYLPALRKLCIAGDFVCKIDAYKEVHRWFPNLEVLELDGVYRIWSDFMYSLAKFEKLVSLELFNVKLTDAHFNDLFEPLWCNDEGSSTRNIPAVAAFKSLKSLSVDLCDDLTDSCLVNGIAYNATLEKLTLSWMFGTKITSLGLNEIERHGRLKLDKNTETGFQTLAEFSSQK